MALNRHRFTVEANLNEEQHRHVERLAKVAGVSKSRVLRQFVQDSLDKSLGTYDPLPSAEALAIALVHATNKNQEN